MTEDELMKKIEKEEKWLIHALNDQTEATSSYSVDIAFDAVKHYVKDYINLQQKTGEWIEHFDEIGKWYECDQCHTDWGGPVNYCPNCGARMEVEE